MAEEGKKQGFTNKAFEMDPAQPALTHSHKVEELDAGPARPAIIHSYKGEEPGDCATHTGHEDPSRAIIMEQLDKILLMLDLFSTRLLETRKKEKRMCDWMLVAQILDRTLFLIFLILIVVVHVTLLLNH